MDTFSDAHYRLVLEYLSDETATFGCPNGPTLDFPRDRWIDLGRPGVVDICPKAGS